MLTFRTTANKGAIGLASMVGSAAGSIYGGPLAATTARAFASKFIPSVTSSTGITGGARALAWNMQRKAAIEHVGFHAFKLGTTYGPIAGGLVGVMATTAALYAAEKAVDYAMHQYHARSRLQLT